jgi:DNA-binding transcriptional LysR family regulator
MDYLRTIETFNAVVKHGSFSAAAEQLGMSRALMTRHVIDLEARIGARLLTRTTRNIALTEIGAEYFKFSQKFLDDLHSAELIARQAQSLPEGLLTVIAPKSFGGSHFSTAVAEFGKLHPKLTVALVLDDEATRSLQISQNDFDVAIRLAPLETKSAAVVRQIGSLKWMLCASPEYIAEHGAPVDLSDLSAHNCLVHTTLAADRIWRLGAARKGVKISGSFQSNSVLAIRRAALAGLGIAQMPTYYISRELAAGRLVPVLPDFPLPPRPVFVLLPANRLIPKKTQLFIRYIAKWYKQSPWEHGLAPASSND